MPERVLRRQGMETPDPTSPLLARLAAGDRTAGRTLFAAIWPRVRRLTGRMLPIPADADDAAQDAMLTVVERIADYDRARPGLPWALAIARFASLTSRKARMRRREVTEDAVPVMIASDAATELEALERVAAIRRAVDRLDDADRRLLLGEPAAPARVSGAVVRKRRQRARLRARKALLCEVREA